MSIDHFVVKFVRIFEVVRDEGGEGKFVGMGFGGRGSEHPDLPSY